MTEATAPRSWGGFITDVIDEAVMAVSPRLGVKRKLARRVWNFHEKQRDTAGVPDVSNGPYEGADSDRLHGHRWMTSRLSADAALEQGMNHGELQQRSRQLYRSDSIGGAIDQDVDHVVGTGFTAQAKVREFSGYCTETQAKKYNDQLELIAEEVFSTIDVSRRMSLWESSRLVKRLNRVDGESITILSDSPSPGKPIPIATEIVDSDRLSTPPEESNNPLCRFGVLRDEYGQITHYYIQRTHPYDNKEFKFSWDKVPANRVIHVFEKWFAGQSRGLPWFTRALHRMLDAKDLDEAGIIAAQVEACYVAFINVPNPGLDANGVANQLADTTELGKRLRDMEPGMISVNTDGATVDFGSPSKGNSSVPALQQMNYHRIAAALNMSYEMLSKDWGGISFAGGRLILAGVKKDVRGRQKRLMESWLTPIWNRMVFEAVLLGKCDIPISKYNDRPAIFQRHRWMPPAWEYCVNPGEEIKAWKMAMDENVITKSQVTAEYSGEDFEDTARERQREREIEREAKIVPPETTKLEMQPPAPAPKPTVKVAA